MPRRRTPDRPDRTRLDPAASLAALVDLVLPRRCVGCRGTSGPLCGVCRPTGEVIETVVTGLPVLAAGEYDGGLRRAVIAYKERGRRDLTAVLAGLLARALQAVRMPGHPAGGGDSRIALVGPPTSRSVAAERGGDHVLRLARSAARGTAVAAVPGVLWRVRDVRDSTGLDRRQREQNLAGAYRAAVPTRVGAPVIVVDDVVTTGATIREATRALHTAGWTVVGAAVVAATPRRFFANPLAAPKHRV